MLTSSYYVDSVKDAFHLALEIELSFKGIFIFKAREYCSMCEEYGHYDCQCPSKRQQVYIVPTDDVDERMSTFLPRLLVSLRIH